MQNAPVPEDLDELIAEKKTMTVREAKRVLGPVCAALAYAQSGHLCLATLHANNSYHVLNRILSFYPVETRPTMLGDLASALKAVAARTNAEYFHAATAADLKKVYETLSSRLTVEKKETEISALLALGVTVWLVRRVSLKVGEKLTLAQDSIADTKA